MVPSAMEGQSYPPARVIAPLVRDHFVRHIDDARRRGLDGVASAPDSGAIEAMIQAAFWASLRREEGYMPRISLAYVSPTEAVHPLQFEQPLPLAPAALTRVAPAVERAGIHLAVWRDGDACTVWGTVRAHGRGGLLLVVPSGADAWRDSIVKPIPYAVQPPYTGLTRLVNQQSDDEHRDAWVQALARTVDAVAGLTAVDGAAIMTRDYEL